MRILVRSNRLEHMQLALNFQTDPNFQRTDFFCSLSNKHAYEWIHLWPKWPSPVLLLNGPEGAGKTHLAHIWAERSNATFIRLAEFEMAELLALCPRHPYFVLDDVEIEGYEETLFHLYNSVREHNGALLLTQRQPLSEWKFTLADLSSRLKSAVSCAIYPPDDDLLRAILLKLFTDRQIKISEEILSYLVMRMERSFGQARQIVEALNTYALEHKRNITLPLVRQVLPHLS